MLMRHHPPGRACNYGSESRLAQKVIAMRILSLSRRHRQSPFIYAHIFLKSSVLMAVCIL